MQIRQYFLQQKLSYAVNIYIKKTFLNRHAQCTRDFYLVIQILKQFQPQYNSRNNCQDDIRFLFCFEIMNAYL